MRSLRLRPGPLIALFFAMSAAAAPAAERPPNVVIVFCDDLGYADVGCFGAEGYQTPNVDRLASEGRRFTDFYVPQAVCSASRAGLLTGCYPNRIGILGALGPKSEHGISDDETTIAEALKAREYATAIFGKWHLGHHPQFLPTRHGFDEYFGLPYSNDMWPKHPTAKSGSYPPLPLIDQERVAETMPDQTQLTTWYTEHAVDFIDRHKDQPFFLYVPHSMPHVPLHVSDKFKGRSQRGLFGDVIMEIDWSVGQILERLDRHALREQTLVIFTSDNGPWLSYGDHAGSAKPLREGKGTQFDGGVRVACVMSWPGQIPPGTATSEPAMTIDLLPTLTKLAGGDLPQHPIDGLDIGPLMFGAADAKSPHEALFFYWGERLESMRSGRWKLHFPHGYRSLDGPAGTGGTPAPYIQRQIGLSLFDLVDDVGETRNVAGENPDVVARLQALADAMRANLGDGPAEAPGRRSAGQLR